MHEPLAWFNSPALLECIGFHSFATKQPLFKWNEFKWIQFHPDSKAEQNIQDTWLQVVEFHGFFGFMSLQVVPMDGWFGDSEWRNSGHTSIHLSSDSIAQTLEIFRVLPIAGGSSLGCPKSWCAVARRFLWFSETLRMGWSTSCDRPATLGEIFKLFFSSPTLLLRILVVGRALVKDVEDGGSFFQQEIAKRFPLDVSAVRFASVPVLLYTWLACKTTENPHQQPWYRNGWEMFELGLLLIIEPA